MLDVNNENECVRMSDCIGSFADSDFSDAFFREIFSFYVLKAPCAKNEKEIKFGLRELKNIGWIGSEQHKILEDKMLKISGIDNFNFLKKEKFDKVYHSLNMDSVTVSETPRSCMVLKEEGNKTESRMCCLFRHIRNSLAHNRTYIHKDMVLFEDFNNNNKKTASIFIKIRTLLDWIDVVEKRQQGSLKETISIYNSTVIIESTDNNLVERQSA